MMACCGVEVCLHAFLTSALDGSAEIPNTPRTSVLPPLQFGRHVKQSLVQLCPRT